MGTSVEMIDRTYGHLAPDAEEYERGLLDAYDAMNGGTMNRPLHAPQDSRFHDLNHS
jgi:hypothetical protein